MLTSIFAFVLVLLTTKQAACNKTEAIEDQETTGNGVYFIPKQLLKIKEYTVHKVEWFTTLPEAHHVTYEVEDETVAYITPFEEVFDSALLEGNETGRGFFNVTAVFLGLNSVNITVYDAENNTLGYETLEVTVILSYEKVNRIFTIILTVLLFTQYINMGATIDLKIVKGILVKPVGPCVALFVQYVLMPVYGFGLAKFVFPDNELRQLGMFLNGASPGGGSSNMWTLLLGGSLDLSIMMTFASTVVAFGTIPMWVLTLGPKIIGADSSITIPYDSIAYSVVALIVPCSTGLLIQRFLPRVAKILEKYVLKGMALFNLIFIVTFGMYAYHYIFSFFTPRVVLGCIALPAMGYLSGFILAYLTKRPWKDIIAITIETGVTNATIPIIILKFTLGQPIGDLSIVIPGCSVLMTPLPLAIALITKIIRQQCCSTGINIKQIPDTKATDKEHGYDNHIVLTETDGKFTANQKLEIESGVTGVTGETEESRSPKSNGELNSKSGFVNPGADFTSET